MTFRPRLAVLAAGLVLAAAELGLGRLGGYGGRPVMEAHPVLGYRLLPDQETDLEVRVAINGAGFRDREWRPEDDRADLRVAVFGDSLVHGMGVAFDETLVPRLEAHLRAARPDLAVRVRGHAVPGYGFEQMARCYEQTARDWRPTHAVFVLTPYSPRPMLPPREPARYPLRSLVRRSALHDWFHRSLLPAVRGEPVSRFVLGEEHEQHGTVLRRVRMDPFGAENASLWQDLARRASGVARDLESRGGRMVLVALPMARDTVVPTEPLLPRLLERIAAEVPGALAVDAWAPFRVRARPLLDSLLAAGCDPHRVPSEDWPHGLEPAGQALFLDDDRRHLAPAGHELLARTVAAALTAPEPGPSSGGEVR